MEELKNCPFCGGEAFKTTEMLRDGITWAVHTIVMCRECGARTQPYCRPFESIKAWNRRVKDDI